MVKDYEYREEATGWSSLYSLDGHPSGIKEKIEIGIGDMLEGNQ